MKVSGQLDAPTALTPVLTV